MFEYFGCNYMYSITTLAHRALTFAHRGAHRATLWATSHKWLALLM